MLLALSPPHFFSPSGVWSGSGSKEACLSSIRLPFSAMGTQRRNRVGRANVFFLNLLIGCQQPLDDGLADVESLCSWCPIAGVLVPVGACGWEPRGGAPPSPPHGVP